MLDDLNARYDSNDENVRLLYKYRSCQPHNIDCLRDDEIWFSTSDELNDPFDCSIRIPKSITAEDVRSVRSFLRGAKPYRLAAASAFEVAEHIGATSGPEPLEMLGLMAVQLQHDSLLMHIRKPKVSDRRWLLKLMTMAREVAEHLLHNVTVFCVSESRVHPLMWAHYAASHAGFCTGYVCPTGIRNPALIHKIEYVDVPKTIAMVQLIDDPSSVLQDLILTKSLPWSYEAEWRVTLGNIPGRVPRLLPYREIIFGNKMLPENEERIRAVVAARDVRFFRAVPNQSSGRFEVRIDPA